MDLSLGIVIVALATALTVVTIPVAGAFVAVLVGLLVAGVISERRSPLIAVAIVAIVIGATSWRPLHQAAGDKSEIGNFSQGGSVNRLYSEWQAGLNMLEWNAAAGVGLGNYQPNIYVYYFGLPYDKPLQPDSLNGYLVLASTGGWLALAMLMTALVYFGGLAVRVARSSPTDMSALAGGLTGALAGFVVAQVYRSLLVRGTGLVIGLVFALIASLASQGEGNHGVRPASSD
jgi:hypothetical protein